MPNHEEIDVESQLRGLFQEAEDHLAHSKRSEGTKTVVRPVEDRAARPAAGSAAPQAGAPAALGAQLSTAQLLRPVMLGLEALVRASGENTALLGKLDGKIDKAAEGVGDARTVLPGLVESLQTLLDQKNGVNQRMFDALHEELKGYKDGFLLESVQKPVICDLISLYDELSLVNGQMQELLGEAANLQGPAGRMVLDRLKTMATNVAHNCEFIAEVLARLEVSMLPMGNGKLDKHSQRAVALEAAEDQLEDGDIVQIKKRGFFWRGRVLRPEEVVMKKWRPTPNPGPSQK